MKNKKIYTYIDLFAGCGGLSLGLNLSEWKGLFAIEKNPQAFQTLEHNLIKKINHFEWPEWLPQQAHDIDTVIKNYSYNLNKLQGEVTLIAGGPPCQGFSIAGRRNEDDERNTLINSYIKFVSLVRPKLIFFENVKGFTMEFKNNKQKGKKYSQIVADKLTKVGYHVYGQLINFGDYGVPQKRTRFILVGIRKDINNSNIEKAKSFFKLIEENKFSFLAEKKLSVSPTIEDALSDLLSNNTIDTPDRKGFKSGIYQKVKSDYQRYIRKGNGNIEIPNSHSFAKHSQIVTERFRYIQSISTECKNIPEKLKRQLGLNTQVLVPLQAKEQAPTVTSHPDDMIHYCEPRILTVRECARLQSFPDWYTFTGKYTTGGELRKIEVPRYTQVGNAIPPLFSEQAGAILKQLI
ncbi:DNA (cytosine-5)-methyltransferase 1 [Flexibacter flexilis DSM 6793]|uniref:DNA (cytosine-5-)-methyltransferase n=1 Tax=Flexibacter flexilis DSM 6793 TaxID=927664 RepID=A0A1I1J8X6_9BACT|nr:DNA cytosine methyltransferase [Flexibacter flexilis]SFC44835.1 DNA (cytosine-5)-methyltransferase 1 [Flexibacter flexilis DSM 6793]